MDNINHEIVIYMDNFCLLAYIPSIILTIWLLIELRKFIIVRKRLKHTEETWNKVQQQRSKKKSDEHFIETIPPPPPHEYSDDYSSSSTRRPPAPEYSSTDYESEDYYEPSTRAPPSRPHRRTGRGRKPKPMGKRPPKEQRDKISQGRRIVDEFDFESEDISEIEDTPPPPRSRRNRRKRQHRSKQSVDSSQDDDIDWD
jgi:hypothetical protein